MRLSLSLIKREPHSWEISHYHPIILTDSPPFIDKKEEEDKEEDKEKEAEANAPTTTISEGVATASSAKEEPERGKY